MPRGGPDGGNGGDGGSVYFRCDVNVNTLLGFRYKRRFVAGDGCHGSGGLKHGSNGADVELVVPVGTQVWGGPKSERLLSDLKSMGQRILVAKGGRGGRGNSSFASSTNRYPLLAEEGEPREDMDLRLELKLLADVGVIGAPNVGKSTLVAAVSAARPKIAEYPFTTLEPVLGVVDRGDDSFVMVEVPGLIEGAHGGAGLGHEFLRHVERTRVLLHLVDGSVGDPARQVTQIDEEMGLFNQELLRKPKIIAVNKIDMREVRQHMGALKSDLAGHGVGVHFISAATGEGLDQLLNEVSRVLQAARTAQAAGPTEPETPSPPVLRPRPRREPVRVSKTNGRYKVSSDSAARIAAMVDLGDWSARLQFYAQLKRMGVVRALEEAGIAPGDTVRIGKVEWEWE